MPIIFLVLLDISGYIISYKFNVFIYSPILSYLYHCCCLYIYYKYLDSICHFIIALYSLYCADVPLKTAHSLTDVLAALYRGRICLAQYATL